MNQKGEREGENKRPKEGTMTEFEYDQERGCVGGERCGGLVGTGRRGTKGKRGVEKKRHNQLHDTRKGNCSSREWRNNPTFPTLSQLLPPSRIRTLLDHFAWVR